MLIKHMTGLISSTSLPNQPDAILSNFSISTPSSHRKTIVAKNGKVYLGGSQAMVRLPSTLNNIEFQIKASVPPGFTYIMGGNVDSDDNGNQYYLVYAAGNSINPMEVALLYKLNSVGTVLWSKTFYVGIVAETEDLCVDNSGNVYALYLKMDTGYTNYKSAVTKYNSTGVHQWSKSFGSGNRADFVVDESTSSVYAFEDSVTPSVIAFNSSGAEIWRKTYAHGYGTYSYYDRASIVLGSNGYLYISTHYNNTTTGYPVIAVIKILASTGVAVSMVEFSYNGTIGGNTSTCLAIDSNNDLYLLNKGGFDTNNIKGIGSLAKFDQNLSLQWKRLFTSPTQTSGPTDIAVDVSQTPDRLYVSINPNAPMVISLPIDGTGQGIYGNYSYIDDTNYFTASMVGVPPSSTWSIASVSVTPLTLANPTTEASSVTLTYG